MDLSRNLYDSKLYTLFRLDGKNFSKLVKLLNLEKPFDQRFTQAMINTTKDCFNVFHFSICFVGSDEITYCIKANPEVTLDYSGRIDKLISILASKVSIRFYINFHKLLNDDQKTILENYAPVFDCRIWQVETYDQVLSNLSERSLFTLKNSRLMLGQQYYSQKMLDKLSSKEVIAKLVNDHGIDFYKTIPAENRVGTIITTKKLEHQKVLENGKTVTYTRPKFVLSNLSPDEIKQINDID